MLLLITTNGYPAEGEENFFKFINLSNDILASGKNLKIVIKSEYDANKNWEENIVATLAKPQALTAYYNAMVVSNIALCYPLLDFKNEKTLERYYGFLQSWFKTFISAAGRSIYSIDVILTRDNRKLESQYPELADMLKKCKEEIKDIIDIVKKFESDNIPKEYLAQVKSE